MIEHKRTSDDDEKSNCKQDRLEPNQLLVIIFQPFKHLARDFPVFWRADMLLVDGDQGITSCNGLRKLVVAEDAKSG
jgi:hypothetical protein